MFWNLWINFEFVGGFGYVWVGFMVSWSCSVQLLLGMIQLSWILVDCMIFLKLVLDWEIVCCG